MEIWKDIEGYEGLYQVSNLGNVKSLGNGNSNNSKEKILKPANKNGYLMVVFSKQGKQKMHYVHRLVGQAFIENPQNLPQINHRNELKTDNRVENLEFCDAKYNNNYGTRTERMAESRINHQKLSKQVLCVETGIIYPSVNEVQRELGFNNGNISKCCNGRIKQAYKFTWRYVS